MRENDCPQSPRSNVLFPRSLRICFVLATFALLGTLLGCAGSHGLNSMVSTGSFDFGNVAVSTQVRRIALTVTNSDTKNPATMAPSLSGDTEFTLDNNVSCGTSLAASSTCSVVLLFTPTSAGSKTATLDLGMTSNNQTIALTGTGVQLSAGQNIVAATDNPLVARYTYAPHIAGNVSIEFGPDTTYGRQTSAIAAAAGAPVSILVAGMTPNSTYHMRATVSGGAETDSDQTFATTNFSADTLPTVNVTTTGTPQAGVELMNPVLGPNNTFLQAYAIDLQGNLIWGYNYTDRQGDTLIQPIKPLPNGDFVMVIAPGSQTLTGPPSPSETVVLREIDLAGVTVRQITLNQMNTALTAAGSSLTLVDLHHDVEVLPNGHWLVLGNIFKTFVSLPGTTGSTNVLGDVVIDFDTNLKPVWIWNEFDHLDINRAPVGYPDWTHSNAILYSPGDGNILVSSRHQSWVMKVDYRNGAGTGNIVWRLGYQGDFTLVNGTEPQDWFFGQHEPNFIGTATSGKFSLTVMDNGFDRHTSPTTACSGASCYTTVPILLVDEVAKTATIQFRDTLDPSKYSFFGGGTTPLANGNLEFDLCAQGKGSEVDEVTVTDPATTVWSAKTPTQNLYRANRMPSLYPGVQW